MIQTIDPDVPTKHDITERASARLAKLAALSARIESGEYDEDHGEKLEVSFHLARRAERGRPAPPARRAASR